MGEVYRARDATRERDVAIKVLSAPFTNDPNDFRVSSAKRDGWPSLNHPGIGAIYGLQAWIKAERP